MNFRKGVREDEPEINFIPLIDVLLVILIFLMVSTTYSKFTELQVNLPSANAETPPDRSNELIIGVGADNQYQVGQESVPYKDAPNFAKALKKIAAEIKEPIVVIHADAGASHQAVVNVLEAARLAGLAKVTFATQSAR
jgi:biopolymer transport protein ExbD